MLHDYMSHRSKRIASTILILGGTIFLRRRNVLVYYNFWDLHIYDLCRGRPNTIEELFNRWWEIMVVYDPCKRTRVSWPLDRKTYLKESFGEVTGTLHAEAVQYIIELLKFWKSKANANMVVMPKVWKKINRITPMKRLEQFNVNTPQILNKNYSNNICFFLDVHT